MYCSKCSVRNPIQSLIFWNAIFNIIQILCLGLLCRKAKNNAYPLYWNRETTNRILIGLNWSRFERIIPRLTCISTIRLAFLLSLTFFLSPCKPRLHSCRDDKIIPAVKTPWMLCFLNFLFSAPLFSRSEAKRIMQIFKLSKHDYRSTSSRANPTVLAEWLVCNSRTVECYGSRIWPIVALEIM